MLLLFSLSFSTQAEINETTDAEIKEEKSWWQLRQERSDIFYPHKPHINIMKQGGDACMLCHPFSKNNIHDEKRPLPIYQRDIF